MAGDVEREMRLFTRELFQQSPDLSVLSQSSVRSRFLSHCGRSALSSPERQILKKIVEEELLKMQKEDVSDDEPLIMKVQKRGRQDSNKDMEPPGKRQRQMGGDDSEEDSGIEQRDSKRLSGSSPEAPVFVTTPIKAEETAAAKKADGSKRRVKTTPKRGKGTTLKSLEEETDQKKVTASSGIKETNTRLEYVDSDSEAEAMKPKVTHKETARADGKERDKATKSPPKNETDSDSHGEKSGQKTEKGKRAQIKVMRVQGKGHNEESARKRAPKKKAAKKDSDSEEEEEENARKRVPKKKAAKKESDSEEEEEETARKRVPKKKAAKKDSDSEEEEEENARKRAPKKKVAKKESDSEEEEEKSSGSKKDSDSEEEESARNRASIVKIPKKDSDEESAGEIRASNDSSDSDESAAEKKDSASESDEKERTGTSAPKSNRKNEAKRSPYKKITKSDSEEDESDLNTESDEEKAKKPETAAGGRKETDGKGAKDKRAESDSKDRAKKKTEGKDEDSDSSARSEPDTKGKSGKKQGVSKEDHPSILRLKKYILTCGARRNYKKLFQDCRSVKAMVEVLKKELEDLGVKGQPSLEKCRMVRLKREEAAELAELDTGNIIATTGRPQRRNTWNPYRPSPVRDDSPYRKTVGSDSEGEEGPPCKKRPMDWSSLKGIISDDGDSD